MIKFVDILERDLLDAAARLQRQSLQTEQKARRFHKLKLLGPLAAVLVVAAPALAGVPGIWHGVLAGSSAPTVTTRPPVEPLLAELGALRRPETPGDRSPDAASAVQESGPLTAVSISDVRFVGTSPIGDPLFLVPYRSRVRLAPGEGLGETPAGKVMFNGHPPTSQQRASLHAIRKHLQRFLNQPGVCLVAVSATSPEIDDCASASEIAAGTGYATVGVYRSRSLQPGAPAPSRGSGHVIASVASEIVPDQVASVELAFASGKTTAIPVHENYFALILSPGEGGVPAITWLTASGRILRRIPPG